MLCLLCINRLLTKTAKLINNDVIPPPCFYRDIVFCPTWVLSEVAAVQCSAVGRDAMLGMSGLDVLQLFWTRGGRCISQPNLTLPSGAPLLLEPRNHLTVQPMHSANRSGGVRATWGSCRAQSCSGL